MTNSPHPHLHPAVQYEGEVQVCKDDFHCQEVKQRHMVQEDLDLRRRMAHNPPKTVKK